jgi:predicted glutamine amidotransferase
MCRLLLYLGQPIVLSKLLVEPANSLINQSVHCKSVDTPVNGDGFGMAWYAPEVSAEPGRFRSLLPAWSNNNLHRLASVVRSGAVLAHVRAASPGLASAEANCHPFTFRDLAFAHNGDVGGFRLIRRGIEATLTDHAFNLIEGSTDSEHLFALLVDRVLEGKKAAGAAGTGGVPRHDRRCAAARERGGRQGALVHQRGRHRRSHGRGVPVQHRHPGAHADAIHLPRHEVRV